MSVPPKIQGPTDRPDPCQQTTHQAAPTRKPYVKPGFVREEVFETTALACGKINPTVQQCNLVRKTS
jgi:hypothetical protein